MPCGLLWLCRPGSGGAATTRRSVAVRCVLLPFIREPGHTFSNIIRRERGFVSLGARGGGGGERGAARRGRRAAARTRRAPRRAHYIVLPYVVSSQPHALTHRDDAYTRDARRTGSGVRPCAVAVAVRKRRGIRNTHAACPLHVRTEALPGLALGVVLRTTPFLGWLCELAIIPAEVI